MIIFKMCMFLSLLFYLLYSARCGAAEIHSIASFVGGVASQEAIKILTKQYIPIHQTFIYNGLQSICGVLKY